MYKRQGYARIKTQVDRLRAEHPNHLWLNAGDEFQGTMFFSFYGWEKITATINQLGFDAMTLGNHEWDRADEQLGAFLKNLTVPIVSCNVRSGYKDLNETIRPYHIFPEHGIAVIGATTPDTLHTSHVGDLTRFLDPVEEIQRAIYEIRNTTGLRRIVALTHIGYDADQDLAARTEGLSLIVGDVYKRQLYVKVHSENDTVTCFESKILIIFRVEKKERNFIPHTSILIA